MTLDSRLHPFREDLAALKLKGLIADRPFAEPRAMRVNRASAALRSKPDWAVGYETELKFGEIFDVYEEMGGFSWGQAQADGYVGYCESASLGVAAPPANARVKVLRTFVYPAPSIKRSPVLALPYGATLSVLERGDRFDRIDEGYVIADHLAPLESFATDPLEEAERFLGIPYLWGGNTSFGLDCSGLVQNVCLLCGISALRDSDMQEASLGMPLEWQDPLAALPRGALLFWPGHVALSAGKGLMIHANGHHMMVVREPIEPALERIATAHAPLRSLRMLPAMASGLSKP
jgi:hypothetical protein